MVLFTSVDVYPSTVSSLTEAVSLVVVELSVVELELVVSEAVTSLEELQDVESELELVDSVLVELPEAVSFAVELTTDVV